MVETTATIRDRRCTAVSSRTAASTSQEGRVVRAVRYHDYGGPNVLHVDEDDPRPPAGGVPLVVITASLNAVVTRIGDQSV
jgi:hypothetical protein